ncbi:hypothetical protein LOZ57_006797 [Ophidiomyces ophidiicola]|uniref:uncharacterized protein n=1 Tax=Ophidiomyces ophidiicola TaxID=1387563 RepID=UPI0020C24148|nr:uncharacterized protein LOZ57_006797 [Ophidiomyces ophidiicola]KAI1907856.1 hypothetical protein LOZ65_006729 [Ophidiomyces ophidiicola]KAI1936153.1 hypothetical protein LOZ57_006797 [Ophidiomyces ophidiicola]KAI2047721.1 hypothetical protein LOZ43_005577 [Ophidiomyces ophidiicola]KAI2083698.1 hypothetical protein LOZ36_005481 [Ophidiomyces ophidiicola]
MSQDHSRDNRSNQDYPCEDITRPQFTPLPAIPEISTLDHQIFLNGGTTSKLERLPSRLQSHKKRSSSLYSTDQLHDLSYENSYLRGELSRLEEYRYALLKLKSKVAFISEMIKEILEGTERSLRDTDSSYLKLYGIEADKMESGGFI